MILREVIYKSEFAPSLMETFAFHLGFIKPGRLEVETGMIVKHVRGFKNKILSCLVLQIYSLRIPDETCYLKGLII